MNPWENLFRQLADSGAIAEWHLANGVTFFMTLPRLEMLDTSGVNSGSFISFGALVRVVVRAVQPLSGLSKTNDLAVLRAALPVAGLYVREHPDSIELSPMA